MIVATSTARLPHRPAHFATGLLRATERSVAAGRPHGGVGAIAYPAIVVAAEVAALLIYVWHSTRARAATPIRFDTPASLLSALLVTVAACVLLLGGVLMLAMHPMSRSVVLWSSAAVAMFWGLTFTVTAGGYIVGNTYPRGVGADFITYHILNVFFVLLYHAFVPVALLFPCTRRDVRDVFGFNR